MAYKMKGFPTMQTSALKDSRKGSKHVSKDTNKHIKDGKETVVEPDPYIPEEDEYAPLSEENKATLERQAGLIKKWHTKFPDENRTPTYQELRTMTVVGKRLTKAQKKEQAEHLRVPKRTIKKKISPTKTHDESKEATDAEIGAVIKEIRSIEKRLGTYRGPNTPKGEEMSSEERKKLQDRRKWLYHLRETTHSD